MDQPRKNLETLNADWFNEMRRAVDWGLRTGLIRKPLSAGQAGIDLDSLRLLNSVARQTNLNPATQPTILPEAGQPALRQAGQRH